MTTMGSVSARTAGLVAVGAAACYVALWVGWAQQWAWLTAVDNAALAPLHDFGVKHPAWVRFWVVFCAVLAPASFQLPALAVVVVAILRRNVRAVVLMVATIGLSGLVNQVAKALANRPRPSTALVGANSSSFPSGHAMGLAVAVLALLAITWGMFGRRGQRVLLVIGTAVVLAVSAGRVVLNVHNPSDVLAGWALGYLWVLGCWLLIRPPPLSAGVVDVTPEVPGSCR
jgi:undecaprenyl-diphosphatase